MKKQCRLFLYLLLILAPVLSYSQTLDDFKTAASSDGVNLIPFPDLRKDATSIADDVQRRKDEAKAFDYNVFESQKNNLLKDIKKKKEEITGLRKEIDDMKSRYTEISLTCFEDDIAKRQKSIDGSNDKIKDMNDKMKNAVDVFERLYNARAGLREYFGKAMSQLSDVSSNASKYLGDNASEDDKKKLEEYTRVIEDQIQSRIKDHRDQEDGARKRKADFESLISRTEPL